ncbi:hypothetical protein POTOM_060048 [Populus tomentosa]|uniref:Berberine/berberine-like domain-containing protein n=1 Tax=Populus tomentosa TaxID=118781 RepID=A0A8X7XUF7_POPTO|nr:hypothetical protein POTOM_060048 [Populus tomentosa]
MLGSFPDLGIVRDDCIEMSWIESILYVYGFPRNTSLNMLLDRSSQSLINFKVKSDFVEEPMAEIVLKEIRERFSDENIEVPAMTFIPYGGKMNKISESSIPFPHRAGSTSYGQASIWGRKYLKNNFDKLVRVKTEVDPANFFRNERSIPPLSPW